MAFTCRVFTTAKRALSFQHKRAFIQEILLYGHFFSLLKKVEGGHMPPLAPGSAAPATVQYNLENLV
jgi:hypothetical protein